MDVSVFSVIFNDLCSVLCVLSVLYLVGMLFRDTVYIKNSVH